jgi:hypothetical protein
MCYTSVGCASLFSTCTTGCSINLYSPHSIFFWQSIAQFVFSYAMGGLARPPFSSSSLTRWMSAGIRRPEGLEGNAGFQLKVAPPQDLIDYNRVAVRTHA